MLHICGASIPPLCDSGSRPTACCKCFTIALSAAGEGTWDLWVAVLAPHFLCGCEQTTRRLGRTPTTGCNATPCCLIATPGDQPPFFFSVASDNSRVWLRGPGLTVETHLWPRGRPQRSRGHQQCCLPGSLEGSFDSMFIAYRGGCVSPTGRPGHTIYRGSRFDDGVDFFQMASCKHPYCCKPL